MVSQCDQVLLFWIDDQKHVSLKTVNFLQNGKDLQHNFNIDVLDQPFNKT